MTLYEMCERWAELAPEECFTDYGDVKLQTRQGENHWLCVMNTKRAPKDAEMHILDAVCFWLEKRRVAFGVKGEWDWVGDAFSGGFAYVYRAWIDEEVEWLDSPKDQTFACALLGTYLKYLEAIELAAKPPKSTP